jgi:hypothetical protein
MMEHLISTNALFKSILGDAIGGLEERKRILN